MVIIEADLSKYKESHRKFLEELVVLHNLHLDYIKHFGRGTGFSLRRCHKSIIKMQKELMKESVRAYNEHRENSKRHFAAQRAEIAQKKSKKRKIK